MFKILDWIKKHVWQTVLIGFGLFLLPLIIVHIAYRIPAISPWFASTWNSGELITYIAGFEAFGGAIFLGAIAAQQNEKANELTKQMQENEERHRLFERQPSLMISKWDSEPIQVEEVFDNNIPVFSYDSNFFDYYFDDVMPNLQLLSITLVNVTQVYAEFSIDHFTLQSYDIDSSKIEYAEMSTSSEKDRFHVLPNNDITLGFVLNQDIFNEKAGMHANFAITMLNSIGELYSEIIEFEITKYYSIVIDGYITFPVKKE
jgi:hypothetical protein